MNNFTNKLQFAFLAIICCSIFYNPIFAQSFTQSVRGNVVDAFTEQPLPGANITILNHANKGASTDVNGDFTISEVPVGLVDVSVTFIGFKPVTLRKLKLNTGKALSISVKLEEDIATLGEVVLTAKTENIDKQRTQNDVITLSARSFTVDETRKYAGSLGDPGTMAANFAGVNGANNDRNDIIIRGNAPSFLLWRMHGMNIPNPNHFAALGTAGGGVGILNNNLLSDSDFLTSAFPAEYGNAVGGVFDLTMRNGNKDEFEYVGQVGFNGLEGGIEGPLGERGSFLVNYRYSTLAFASNLGLDAGLQGAVPEYQDVSFKVDLPTENAGRFAIFGIGGTSEINLLDKNKEGNDETDLGTPDNSDVKFGTDLGIIGVNHTYFINSNTTLKSTVGWSFSKSDRTVDTIQKTRVGTSNDFNIVQTKKYNEQASTVTTYDLNTQLKIKLAPNQSLSFGAIADIYNLNYTENTDRDPFDLDNDGNLNNFVQADVNRSGMALLQGYAQWKHDVSEQFGYYLGVNNQYFSLSDDYVIEPRVGITFTPAPKHRLSAGYGMHSQIQALPLYFVNQRGNNNNILKKETNVGLTFTRAHHAVLGYDYSLSENVRIKVEGYYQRLFDVPVEDKSTAYSVLNLGAQFNVEFLPNLVNEGTGTNYGVEFTLEKFLSDNYYYLLTASLFEAKYEGGDGIERNNAFNNNYIVTALAGYELPINDAFSLDFNIRLNSAGGRRKLLVDLEESRAQGTAIFSDDRAFEEQFDPYFRLDIKFGVLWNVVQGFSQELSVDLQNATNRKNIFSERFDIATETTKQTFLRGIFPVVTYRALF